MAQALALKLGINLFLAEVIVFAASMVASSIISKVFAPDIPNQQGTPNPGSRQQLPPAGDNKLPVIYGSAYVGGIITDLTISNNNQDIYWVLALSEVTNTESGGTPDVITFGDIFWGGKKVIFSTTTGQTYKVTGLQDPSTGVVQDVTGYMEIYLYNNGSNNPTNSTLAAYTVLSASNLVYTWTTAKQMSNTAFAIVHIKYSQSRNLTGLSQTRFQITNSRKAPGDCFLDYMISKRYGAAILLAQIDTASLTALNTYSNQVITYTPYTGGSATQKRYEFNGTLDTNLKIMQVLQAMADSCNVLIKYNEILSLWGVIIQQPTNTIVMDINDSNMVSSIAITPIDLSNSFNIIECKYPDSSNQDSFSTSTLDLSIVFPSLLFPNEPINKQSVNLYLVNNNVTAQYLANIMLKAAREDLQLNCEVDYSGIQLEAGDIVTVTNANYGWAAKQFRVGKVTEKFSDSGQVTAELNLMEFNGAVYDDASITQFTPAPNTGLGSPSAFGSVPAPTILTTLPNAANPAFSVTVTTSSAGITQYAEVWYSAYQFPTDAQRIFAGTTAIQANGDPYTINFIMPDVQLFNIPAGNWYFFSRMVNSIASSSFSLASTVLQWRPMTFQYSERYLAVAYGTSITGTGFSFSPSGATYYGLLNQTTTTAPSTASSYNWYLADPAFGTNKYLTYINYGNRKFGFDTDFADYAAGSGAFVPTTVSQFDPRLWAALDPASTTPNVIDLDHSTGQVTQTGTTTVGTGQVAITNTNNGQLVASLQQFLSFGGAPTYTASAATITVDIYGRVVGFSAPDNMYFSFQNFTATSGQTIFTPTARQAGYITGQDLIFRNGALLDTTDYSETSTTFTLAVGATTGDIVSVLSFRAVSSAIYYENTFLTVQTTSTNTVTYNSTQLPYQLFNVGDVITFDNTGSPTQYTISAVNYTTRLITVGTTISGVASGATIYRYRAATSSYPVFSRWSFDLTSASTYTPTTWAFNSGYELLFINGTILNEQDYDLVSGALTNFPASTTGKVTAIQWSANNLGIPTGIPANVVAFTATGTPTYAFTYSSASGFNLYANGLYLNQGVDYTTGTNTYTFLNTPTNSSTVLVQETFARVSAA